ncbi:MAG TPA: DUF1223 domain-containing protein [Polyangiaceae bacterium]|jgi:hypothetical protein
MRLFLAALACIVVTSSTMAAGDGGPRVPVVVELFSSEGCSSCPPADVLLARLDRDQPIAGAEVIALEFHVDYWNYLGWSDPFSSAAFSSRQRKRAQYTGTSGVYTPQMVVDGQEEFTGSRETAARSAIEHAARAAHVPVKLAREGDAITIDVGAIPTNETTRVMLAVTERGLRTNVLAGENRGSTLEHGPVVRSLRDLGTERRITQPRVAGRRVVVFVETRDSMHVLGAATID